MTLSAHPHHGGTWLHPATPADWAVRILTISVVLMLAASLLLWDAVQKVRDAQRQAEMRGCLILTTQQVSAAELSRVGCR